MIPVAALLAVLLTGVPDDEADLRQSAVKLFAALKAGDVEAVMSGWSAQSPSRAAFRAAAEEAVKNPSSVPPSDFQIKVVVLKGDEAVARFSFQGKWSKEEEAWTDEPRTIWEVEFRKTGGTWSWWGQAPAAEALGRALIERPSEEHRALLESDRELAGARLVEFLRGRIDVSLLNGFPELARKAGESAAEVAAFANRKDLEARALLSLGMFLVNVDKPGDALPSLTRSRDLAAEGKDAATEAMARAYRGFVLSDTHSPDAALEELGAGLALARKNSVAEGTFYSLLFTGVAHERRGASDLALLGFREARDFAVTSGRDDLRALALDGLARLQWGTSDYGNALNTAQEALKLVEGPEDAVLRAKLLNTTGLVLVASGEYPKARERFEEGFKLYSGLKLWRLAGAFQNNLGQAYEGERKYEEAAEAYRAALAMLEDAGDVPMAVVARNNIGTMLLFSDKKDKTAQAVQEFSLAWEHSKKLPSQAAQVIPLANLAFAQEANDEHGTAVKTAEAAVELADRHGSPNDRYAAHAGLGRILLEGTIWDAKRAIDELGKASESLEQSRTGLRDPGLQQGFLARHARLYYQIADRCLALNRRLDGFAASERIKGRTLMDLYGKNGARISKDLSLEEREEEARLSGAVDVLSRNLRSASVSSAQEPLEKQLGIARTALDDFRRNLALRHPDLETLRGRFAPVSMAELNRSVLQGERPAALVTYLAGRSRILILVALPGDGEAELKWTRSSIPLETLEDDVNEFRVGCSKANGDFAASSRRLHRALILPIAKMLKNVKHLVIVPDGPLHGIAFPALQDDDGRYLAETWSVSYAPSASALVKMSALAAQRKANPPAGRSALLAVGSPAMPPPYGALPTAEREARRLAEACGVTALVGADARKSDVVSRMKTARLVHIATHGNVDDASPLYSFVVLAPDGEKEGLLYAHEIAELDLQADLVVLSACNTGLGRQVRGEGVVGLTWALFAAGSPASVVSLWQVVDDASGELMRSFYQGIGTAYPRPAGAPALAEALNAAQLQLLRDGSHAHPYYWAPFIFVGDPR